MYFSSGDLYINIQSSLYESNILMLRPKTKNQTACGQENQETEPIKDINVYKNKLLIL